MRWLMYIWAAPAAAAGWALYILPLWAFGLIKPVFVHEGPIIEFRKQQGPQWWESRWGGWFGHSWWFAILVDVPAGETPDRRQLRHELWHAREQWLPLGILFPPIYLGLLCLLALYYGSWGSAYRAHPMELAAEQYAWRSEDD